jgi:hypothetical protein
LTLESFLDALAAFAGDMHGYYANVRSGVNCDTASWRVFADTLLAARVYE